MSQIRIGINAMSLIGPMQKDFKGVIGQLKAGGADYLELMSDWGAKQETIDFYAGFTGGSSGWDRENTVKRLAYMNSVGFPAVGMFIFDEVLPEQAEWMGKYCLENRISYAVLSFLSYEKGIDSVYEKIELIRNTAKVLKPYGVQLVLHNHEHDFLKMTDRDGKEKYIIDIFLQQLTAEELMLELDTGWLLYAGVDYISYIHDNIDRTMILHFKDISRDYQTVKREDIFVPCGKGAVDFAAVLAAVPEKDRDRVLYVLDQDASKGDIVQDQIESVQYIKKIYRRQNMEEEKINAVAIDFDGDGTVDAVAMDTTGDGNPDTILVDTTGDGEADTVLLDTDGDGEVDTVVGLEDEEDEEDAEEYYDAEDIEAVLCTMRENGVPELEALRSILGSLGIENPYEQPAEPVALDTTGDGQVDTVLVDTTGDGKLDTAFIDVDGNGTVDIAVDISEEN